MGAAEGIALCALVVSARAGEEVDAMEAGSRVSSSLSLVVLETGNTLLTSYAVSELLLRRKSPWDLRLLFASIVLLNLGLSPRVRLVAGGAAAGTAALMLHLSPWRSALSDSSSSNIPALPAAASAAVGAWAESEAAMFTMFRWATSPAMRGFLRIFIVACGFVTLIYFDVRRLRQQPFTLLAFAHELRAAVGMVLPVFPFLVAGFSCCFLVVSSLLGKAGLPEELGEELILYGQFYAPFSAVYWIMKREWLAAERNAPLLPMASTDREKRIKRFSHEE